MFDVKQLIEAYHKNITVIEKENGVLVMPLFFHIDSDESIILRFCAAESGIPTITDCGTTKEYLQLRDIRMEDYREKLEAIKERFFIEENDGVFSAVIPTNDLQHAGVYVSYFIQAISVIANIDL